MISRYYEVVCDACKCAIGHYNTYSRHDAEQCARDDGAIIIGTKHFCGTSCKKDYDTDAEK